MSCLTRPRDVAPPANSGSSNKLCIEVWSRRPDLFKLGYVPRPGKTSHARMNYGPSRQSPLGQVLIISDGNVTTDDQTQDRHKGNKEERRGRVGARDQGLGLKRES